MLTNSRGPFQRQWIERAASLPGGHSRETRDEPHHRPPSLDMTIRPARFASARARHDVFACALLAGVVLVLFGRASVTGAVLAPTDSIFFTPFFADEKPAHLRYPGNPLLFDQVYQFVPWRRFAWETLQAGRLPLWNPHSHAGAPFVATMQAAVFYPINLLLVPLPFEQTLAWSAILKLWIAGTLTYLLARRYQLGPPASLISALAFMLSSFLIVWLGHPHTNVAVWLPGILLLDELLLTASSRAQRVRYAALLAVLVGVQFTGGHPETSADVLVIAALYHVLRWSQVILPVRGSLRAKFGHLLLLPGAAVVLGVGLASIQLLPFLEWLPLSAEYHARVSDKFVGAGFWKYLFFLPLAVYPNLYGNPTWPLPPTRSLLPWGQNFNEDVLYVGILPLILAIMALMHWRGRPPQVTVWAVIGGVALGRSLHLPVLDWLNQLPVLSLGNPHRQRLVWSLSMGVLAGFGAQAWWSRSADREPRGSGYWLRLNVTVVALGVLLAIMGAGVLPLIKGTLTAAGRHIAELEFAARVGGAYPLSHYYQRSDEALAKLLWSFRIDNISMYLPALISAASLAATLWVLRGPVQRWTTLPLFLVSLTILDLLAFAWRYNPVISAPSFYPRPAAVARMARDRSLFRFTATGMDLFPDAQMMYGLSDVRSCDFSTQWFSTYVGMIPETFRWISYGTTFQGFSSPLLQVLNLKYVFSTRADFPIGGARADAVLASGASRLWRLGSVQPRSFLVHEALVARDDSQAVRAIRAAPEAVYRRVVLSADAPAPRPMAAAGDSTRGDPSAVIVLRYSAEESVWKVRSTEPGYLVTTDAYYPGWRAYVDGVPTPIYRANIAFRAIEVPEGEHRVVYRYEPTWLPLAVTLEAVSALVIALGLAWSAVRSGGIKRTPAVRPM